MRLWLGHWAGHTTPGLRRGHGYQGDDSNLLAATFDASWPGTLGSLCQGVPWLPGAAVQGTRAAA